MADYKIKDQSPFCKEWEDADGDRGCSILLSRDEAKELARVARQHAPSYTALASTLEEMSRGEMDILCLQVL